jgi:hypothetical protein
MTTDARSKILERVRALLAKASGTNFPEEADAFRRKADELMTAYAIEEWQLSQAGEDNKQVQPEIRWFDFSWWRSNAFKGQLWTLFIAVAKHCRCQTVSEKAKYDWNYDEQIPDYKMPVIGLPSDLDWFDLLFTNLMIAMVQKVDPQPRPEFSMEENLALMREAGMPWHDALNRLALAGVIPSLASEAAVKQADETSEEVSYHDDDKFIYGSKDKKQYFSKKTYESTIRAYRAWCARTGHPQSYVSQVTFRKSFADGFAAEINSRLFRMRRESEQSYDNSHDSGSMALAVRDIKLVIIEMMYEEWPDLRPHPANCSCEKCEAYREAMKKPIKYKPSRRAPVEEKVDWAAREAGRAAGRAVSLTNKPGERVGNTNQPALPGAE